MPSAPGVPLSAGTRLPLGDAQLGCGVAHATCPIWIRHNATLIGSGRVLDRLAPRQALRIPGTPGSPVLIGLKRDRPPSSRRILQVPGAPNRMAAHGRLNRYLNIAIAVAVAVADHVLLSICEHRRPETATAGTLDALICPFPLSHPKMLAAEQLRLLVRVCFATCVAAADAGDDFSNNLFTDLGPLLALFGERVTTQFMSQSTGWADNVVLAMAPLGILTAIVSAIRVGGPPWLRAIIGRARESRAVAEAELMSSTSNEVCELWNGQEVVRVMGSGQIREFIILLPEESSDGERASTATTSQGTVVMELGDTLEPEPKPAVEPETAARPMNSEEQYYLTKYQPTIRDLIFGNPLQRQHPSKPETRPDGGGLPEMLPSPASQPEPDLEKGQPGPGAREFGNDPTSEKHGESPGPEQQSRQSSPVVVIRNKYVDTPNLTLNVGQVDRRELYLVAIIGTILQLGVLVFSGFATYHPTLRWLKDGNPVAGYAYPCTAAGTLLLVAGMLICSHVVESSTSETGYRPAPVREARVVWLQRSGTVNDQTFESFAIFPAKARPLVTTSRRASPSEQGNGKLASIFSALWKLISGTMKINVAVLEIKIEEAITVAATLVSICGFVVQFIGLRGMHWSASIAQLVAIIVMVILRAAVRRNLAQLPKSQPILSGHELDWLAMTLGGARTKAPWMDPSKVDENRRSRPWADGGAGWDWRVSAVEDPAKRKKLEPVRGTTGTSANESKKLVQPNENGDREIHKTRDSAIQDKSCNSRSEAHRVMKIRRDLGKLADWHGPASSEAIFLARAIEVAAGALLPTLTGTLTWSLEVCGKPIHFRLEPKHTGAWKAFSDEIEAALSLWLYSVDDKENGPEGDGENGKEMQGDNEIGHQTQMEDDENGTAVDDDAWLRAKGSPAKLCLRLLGPYTAALYQDLRWWMPDGAARVIEVDDPESKNESRVMEVEIHRVVGFASKVVCGSPTGIDIGQYKRKSPEFPCEDGPLAVESYSPLKTLYTQHMFSAFVWTVAKTMEPIEDRADVRPVREDGVSGDSTWKSIALHSTRLSKLAQDIQATGFGSLEEIYLAIVPPLSAENKLPCADAIIEWTRENAKPHELLGHWAEAADAYLWLFRTAQMFPGRGDIATKATALLMEYLRAVTDTIKLRKAQHFEERGIRELERLKLKLDYTLQAAGNLLREGAEVNLRDIDRKAPIHHAAEHGHCPVVQSLIEAGADINLVDALGHTPLFWAAYKGHKDVAGNLWEVSNMRLRDHNGRTPLHLAALTGMDKAVRLLLDRGADVKAKDGYGATPLHWAAEGGHEAVTRLLLDSSADVKTRDTHNDATPLHRAAEGGHKAVTRLLLDRGADIKAKTRYGKTPLHQAARDGHEAVTRLLLDRGADVKAKDNRDGTPFYQAVRGGHEVVARLLLDKLDRSAAIDATDDGGQTPLD
ncbi:hypothetical protein DL769_003246 [Monosporascus sp. CRB-8-3]|nr:hypothetical protein DL769_003246 [Monosporascus sp. CRB-8-3]